jgi:hypothetical protein
MIGRGQPANGKIRKVMNLPALADADQGLIKKMFHVKHVR